MKYHALKALVLFFPWTAYGHHPMGGETPQNAIDGLLSGLGHPIIELDHFLFIVGFAALIAVSSRQVFSHVGIFLGMALTGTAFRLVYPYIEIFEAGVFASSVIVGFLLIARSLDRTQHLWVVAPVCGIVHGYGYGGAIIGAESTPLFTYLFGFSLIQAILMLSIAFVVGYLANKGTTKALEQYRMILGGAITTPGFYSLTRYPLVKPTGSGSKEKSV